MKKIIRHTLLSPLSEEFQPPLLQRIYAARGIESKNSIDYQLKNLIKPNLLRDIDKACSILFAALQKQQKVLIIGDYDTDGATSTALAISALKQFGFKNVDFLVPNRFTFGYGLTPKIVEHAQEKFSPDLLITVDNGISSIDGVKTANDLGIQVLVTDHHLAGEQLPDAAAIVNPNQPQDEFPSKNLAGVGVIFYVMLALRGKLRTENWFTNNAYPEPNMAQFLSLVALGTVADVVPLDYNNRILVDQGIKQIKTALNNFGIHALLQISKRNINLLSASDLGFAIGPRLNAAGRLDDMSLGINCLLAKSRQEALLAAQKLDDLNRERRELETQMRDDALKTVQNIKLTSGTSIPAGLCLYEPDWHQGVIGIVASRIKDKINRPVIAFSRVSDTEMKGSARSIEGVHIRDLLSDIATTHPELINKFGGHAQAAGLSINPENYQLFSQLFSEETAKHLDTDDLHSKIYTDGELQPEEFSMQTAEMLYAAGPFGQGFPQPIFDGIFELVDQRLLAGKHLKMTLAYPKSRIFLNAISFNIDPNKWPNHRAKKVLAVYKLDINEYLDRRNIQLIVDYLQEA